MKKRWILALTLAGVLTMTGACGDKKEAKTNETPNETETAAGESKSKVVKLGNYKGVKAEAASTEVTEEEIQAEIDALLAYYPATRPIEGKTVIENGDTVNIDFVGRSGI